MNSGLDVDQMIKQYFFQNKTYLRSTYSIQVDNHFGIAVPLDNVEITNTLSLIKILNQAAKAGSNPFIHIAQYTSKRVNFFCRKENEDKCST